MNQQMLAQRLKKARENAGLSVRDATEKLGYPDVQTLTSIEKGERKVTVAELNQFATAYFCFLGSLLDENSNADAPAKAMTEGIEPAVRYRRQQYALLKRLLGLKDAGETELSDFTDEQFNRLAVECLKKGLLSRGRFAEFIGIDRCEIDMFIREKRELSEPAPGDVS